MNCQLPKMSYQTIVTRVYKIESRQILLRQIVLWQTELNPPETYILKTGRHQLFKVEIIKISLKKAFEMSSRQNWGSECSKVFPVRNSIK